MALKKQIKEYKEEIVSVLSEISNDKNLLDEFLKDLLTPDEYESVAVRWQIIKRLAKNEHHHSIVADLRVGVATVNRGALEFKNPNGGFKQVYKKLNPKYSEKN
jgi:Trp operon repressor